jgi:hypothetical protein
MLQNSFEDQSSRIRTKTAMHSHPIGFTFGPGFDTATERATRYFCRSSHAANVVLDRRIAVAALGLAIFGYATELTSLASATIWIWWPQSTDQVNGSSVKAHASISGYFRILHALYEAPQVASPVSL